MPPRRRRDEEEDDDADAFGSADSQLSGSDVEDAGKEPPGLTMQAGGEDTKEKEEKEDEETANADEKDEKDEVEKEAKEKDEAKDNEDEEKEDEEKEDEKEEDSKDYADAASHVSEEAQKEAKVPTNSRYFLHDDRRVNEEEKEDKEETSKETSKEANRSGRRNDKGDPDADGKWDHDMYYKLLEEVPRAKAPRVPNDSWSTMGRRKPGYGSEDWSWNTKKDDAWQYEKWEKPAEARHPRRSREQNAWDQWNKGSEWDDPWATEETWEEPKKGKGRGKGNRSWKNDWTQEEEWNEEWNEEWEGEEQGEWIWKPRKGRNATNNTNTTATRWNQHDDRGARKMPQAEEAWWC